MGCGSSAPKSAYVFRTEHTQESLDRGVRRLSQANRRESEGSGGTPVGAHGMDWTGTPTSSGWARAKRRSQASSEEKLDKAAYSGRGNSRMTKRGSSAAAEAASPPTRKNFRPTEFDFRKCVGQGAYARVWLAQNARDQGWYAVKVVKKLNAAKPSRAEALAFEKYSLTAVHHPFVLRLHGTMQDATAVYFVTEFLPGGELFSHMHKRKRLPEEEAKFYLAEVLMGLAAMHNAGIMYRDLKPENVVLDKMGHVRLVDLGFARPVDKRGFCKGKVGTPHYLAPELLHKSAEEGGYPIAVDFWAFGCLMFEMLAGKGAFGHASDSVHAVYTRVMKSPGSLRIPGGVSAAAKALIKGLLTPDVGARISDLPSIMGHAWFKGTDWTAVGEARMVPPFKPRLNSAHDTAYFDSYSASEEARGGKGGGKGNGKGGGRRKVRDAEPSSAELDALFSGF